MRAPALALLLVLAAAPAVRAETADSDPRAVAIADRVMAALGGSERWQALRVLRWTFESAVSDTLRPGRRHSWDRHTGWHRVEGRDRAGRPFCTIQDLDDSTGMAWVAGVAQEGDSLRRLLRSGRALWTNDSYWFLMPYKLRDPGVTLRMAGEVVEDGVTYDVLGLSFAGVGLTPGDRYWVYVNRANDRVERWEYILQNAEPPPLRWTWEGWERHGDLWFPTLRRHERRAIHTRAVETAAAPRPGEFTAP